MQKTYFKITRQAKKSIVLEENEKVFTIDKL